MGMWVDIDGSMLTRARFDEDARKMVIQFKNGAMYEYNDIDEDDFQAMVNSPSPGAYFHENIKGNYDDRRIG